MIAFKDKRTLKFVAHANLSNSFTLTNHNSYAIPEKIRSACYVCMLENEIQKIFRNEDKPSQLAKILGTSVDEMKKGRDCLALETWHVV